MLSNNLLQYLTLKVLTISNNFSSISNKYEIALHHKKVLIIFQIEFITNELVKQKIFPKKINMRYVTYRLKDMLSLIIRYASR
jgi:hypothetical protein